MCQTFSKAACSKVLKKFTDICINIQHALININTKQ